MSADIDEIQRLSADYCWYVDSSDLDPLLDVFVSDGVFDAEPVGLTRMQGRSELSEFFAGVFASMSSSQHLTGNHRINIDGDEASASSYYLMHGIVQGGTPISAAGRYEDRWVRTPSGWRIALRRGIPLLPPDLQAMKERL